MGNKIDAKKIFCTQQYGMSMIRGNLDVLQCDISEAQNSDDPPVAYVFMLLTREGKVYSNGCGETENVNRLLEQAKRDSEYTSELDTEEER